MKKILILLTACLLLNACASPPQPYGSRTPVNINHNAYQDPILEQAADVLLDSQ